MSRTTVTDSSFIGHSNEKQSCSDPFMISICLHVMTFRKGVDVCVFRCCLAARQRRMALDIVSATPVRHAHTVDDLGLVPSRVPIVDAPTHLSQERPALAQFEF